MTDTTQTLAGALALAQSEMNNPTRNTTNGHFKTRYADLAQCRDSVLPVLAKHGIALVQMAETTEDGRSVTLQTVLLYGTERMDCGTLRLPLSGQNLSHALGSALTYMRRYSLCAVAGVAADDDDDGNNYTGTHTPRAASKPAPRPTPKQQDAPLRTVFGDLEAALLEAFGPAESKEGIERANELSQRVLGKPIGAVFVGGVAAEARALLSELEG